MQTQRIGLFLFSLALFSFSGCGESAPASSAAAPAKPAQTTVFLSVASDINEKPQSVDMAMKFAGFSLAENKKVVMFFNVKGVHIPTAGLSEELAFGENEPIKKQLAQLIEKGVEVHVCPICMKALDVEEGDLMEGAQVTTRPGLFAHIGSDTVVFTY